MKKSIKWIILAVMLAVVIAGAWMLYSEFSDKYKPDNFSDSSQSDDSGQTEEETTPAPLFNVEDYEGNTINLSDFRGKPVVINFWATWCYYCKEEMPDFDKAYREYPEVQFMMIDAADGYQETVEKAKAYVKENGFEFDVYFDTKSEAVNAYYLSGLPATYFIDKEGNLVAGANGMIDYETLEKGIKMITE